MKKSLLAVSLAAATGLGVSQNAFADAYAYAYNRIFDLVITSSTGIIPASAVFDLSNTANLTGYAGETNSLQFSSGSAAFTIDDANLGIASSALFAKNGNIGQNYARGDAEIVASELNPGAPPSVNAGVKTDTWAVAESYLSTKAAGTSRGTTGSTSTFLFVVPLDDEDPANVGTSLTFQFEALMELIACVDEGGSTCAVTPAAFPSNAKASSSVSFVITNSGGSKVFDWAPGTGPTIGDAGGSLNPWSLNTNTGRDQSNTGVAQDIRSTAGNDYFYAQTVALGAGTYTLTLTDSKEVITNLNPRVVPEPETLALMGIGLLGMFAAGRRRQA